MYAALDEEGLRPQSFFSLLPWTATTFRLGQELQALAVEQQTLEAKVEAEAARAAARVEAEAARAAAKAEADALSVKRAESKAAGDAVGSPWVPFMQMRDKALELEFREALATELSKTHKNVVPWCENDIVFQSADKKQKRQVIHPPCGKLLPHYETGKA